MMNKGLFISFFTLLGIFIAVVMLQVCIPGAW